MTFLQQILLFLLSAAIHEVGHILTAKIFGIPMRFFRFCGSGAVMSFDFSRTAYLREAAVHFGGAFFSLTAVFFTVLCLGERGYFFFGVTVVLSFVNLLPIDGTDGGAALRAGLLNFMLPDAAEKICHVVSWIVWAVLWYAVVSIEMLGSGNISLMAFVVGLMFANIRGDY